MKSDFPKLYERTRQHVLTSNKKLPVFVRALLPRLQDQTEYKRLAKDEDWLKQVIITCKQCHERLHSRFMDQAA